MSETEDVTVIETYQDGDGQWRWRLQDPGNNRIVGASSQGFHDEAECQQNALRNKAAFEKQLVFKRVES